MTTNEARGKVLATGLWNLRGAENVMCRKTKMAVDSLKETKCRLWRPHAVSFLKNRGF